MYPRSPIANVQDHYRLMELSSKLESADSHGLVAILYEELLLSLNVLAAALRQGRDLAREHHATRAKSILIALSSSLDLDQGQSIAATLDTVYRTMMVQFDQAIKDRDGGKLAELRAGLVNMSEAWNAIATRRN